MKGSGRNRLRLFVTSQTFCSLTILSDVSWGPILPHRYPLTHFWGEKGKLSPVHPASVFFTERFKHFSICGRWLCPFSLPVLSYHLLQELRYGMSFLPLCLLMDSFLCRRWHLHLDAELSPLLPAFNHHSTSSSSLHCSGPSLIHQRSRISCSSTSDRFRFSSPACSHFFVLCLD